MADVDTNDVSRPWEASYPAGVNWHAPIEVGPLPALLERTAALRGDKTAFDFLGHTTTWAEADAAATRIAAGLQAMGLTKGARLGLLLPNCPAYPLLFFGALKAGLTVVNCNPLYTEREIEAQIRDAGVTVVAAVDVATIYAKASALLARGVLQRIIVCPFAEMMPAGKRMLFRLFRRKELALVPHDARHIRLPELAACTDPLQPVTIDPQLDIAVLQYTGGTTGTPKGAMLTHANLYANTVQMRLWFKDVKPGQERVLAVLPFFHVFAMTTVLLAAVDGGQEIIMLPRFELTSVIRTIARRRPTMLPGVPTLFAAIAGYRGKADLSSIRFCISGGAPLPQEVKRNFEARTGCTLVEGYGLTEASPCISCNPPDGRNKAGSIGLPFPGTDISLRGLDDPLRRVAQGESGELCVRGPQVMRGYWNRPEETRDAFVGGWLRTGDVAVMDDDGYFAIVDRIKDLILVNGFNVYPRAVEEAIYRHPAVAECTVIGVPDPYHGEVAKAFVVCKPDKALQGAELALFLRDHLAPIELPRQIEFRDSLPKTLIGKLSKKELIAEERARFAASQEGAESVGR
jgi:long-chain acyl-CoA synthetase